MNSLKPNRALPRPPLDSMYRPKRPRVRSSACSKPTPRTSSTVLGFPASEADCVAISRRAERLSLCVPALAQGRCCDHNVVNSFKGQILAYCGADQICRLKGDGGDFCTLDEECSAGCDTKLQRSEQNRSLGVFFTRETCASGG